MALVGLNDRLALNALYVFQTMGIRVPQDISLVGYDNRPQSAETVAGLTTIDLKIHQWGEIAAEMLLDVLNGGFPDPVIMTTELVVRDSTAPPREYDDLGAKFLNTEGVL